MAGDDRTCRALVTSASRRVVAERGAGALDAPQLRSMLGDAVGAGAQGCRDLLDLAAAVARDGVATFARSAPQRAAYDRYVAQVAATVGTDPEQAGWAVATWFDALGVAVPAPMGGTGSRDDGVWVPPDRAPEVPPGDLGRGRRTMVLAAGALAVMLVVAGLVVAASRSGDEGARPETPGEGTAGRSTTTTSTTTTTTPRRIPRTDRPDRYEVTAVEIASCYKETCDDHYSGQVWSIPKPIATGSADVVGIGAGEELVPLDPGDCASVLDTPAPDRCYGLTTTNSQVPGSFTCEGAVEATTSWWVGLPAGDGTDPPSELDVRVRLYQQEPCGADFVNGDVTFDATLVLADA